MKTHAVLAPLLAATALMATPLAPAVAQQFGPVPAGCDASPTPSATPPAYGADSGTRPGSAGSTGWTGGTRGSHIGTTPGAPTPASPTDHPATVQGVNPSVEGPVRREC